ncbi:hypothetical protein D9M69_597680 [compost metagenome]
MKQSPSGMSSITHSLVVASSPATTPEWIRKLRTPRSAISIVVAVLEPPPPSSVVTKILPASSTAVSNIPTLSISTIIMLNGAAKARMASSPRCCWILSSRICTAANGTKSRVLPPEWMSST